jgi:hypothetical protein
MSVPNMALQRFEDHKDNPMVQALTRFITFNLKRELSSVASWGVEVSEKPVRSFFLLFIDGTKLSGRLEAMWTVRGFEYEQEKA